MRVIARLTAVFATSNVLRAAIGLSTAVVVSRGLGVEAFGRYSVAVAAAATLMALADLGFGALLTREAARDADDIGALVGAALLARLACLTPIATLLLLIGPGFLAPIEAPGVVRPILLIALTGSACRCFAAPLRTRPEWLVRIVALETAAMLLQLAAMCWMVTRGTTVLALMALAAGVQAGQLAGTAALWRAVARDRWLARPTPVRALDAARRAMPFALTALVGDGKMRLPPLMLGYLTAPADVAAYMAASKLGNVARTISSAAFAAALPAFALEARRRPAGPLGARFDRVVGIFAVVSALGLAIAGGPFLKLTYGRAFPVRPSTILWVSIGLVPLLLNTSRKVYLQALGRERTSLQWSAAGLIVQSAASLALIPPFGSAGAAAAFAAGEAAVAWPLRAADTAPAAVSPGITAAVAHD